MGLKPAYGRVGRYGVFALATSMDHVGPMTRTVEDAAIMFEAMSRPDPRDLPSLPDPVPSVRAAPGQSIARLRIGFDHRYTINDVDPDVAAAMDEVLVELTRSGIASCARVRSARHPWRARRSPEGPITSLGINRILAGDGRLHGVSIDGGRSSQKGDGSIR